MYGCALTSQALLSSPLLSSPHPCPPLYLQTAPGSLRGAPDPGAPGCGVPGRGVPCAAAAAAPGGSAPGPGVPGRGAPGRGAPGRGALGRGAPGLSWWRDGGSPRGRPCLRPPLHLGRTSKNNVLKWCQTLKGTYYTTRCECD